MILKWWGIKPKGKKKGNDTNWYLVPKCKMTSKMGKLGNKYMLPFRTRRKQPKNVTKVYHSR